MNSESVNSYDILLSGVYTGFILAAILTGLLLKLYGLKGVFVGIITNGVTHATFLSGEGILDRGHNPPFLQIVIAMLFFLILTSVFTIGIYTLMKRKKRSPEFLSSIGLFLCSVFFWNLYVPAIYALIMLVLPERPLKAS